MLEDAGDSEICQSVRANYLIYLHKRDTLRKSTIITIQILLDIKIIAHDLV